MKNFVLAASLLLLFWHWFDPAVKKVRQGVDYYNEQQWNLALSSFLSAKNIEKESGEILFNVGTVLFRQRKYAQAAGEFTGSLRRIASPYRGAVHFNLGLCHFMEKDYQAALLSFRKALLYDPADNDARINLELTLGLLQESGAPPEGDSGQNSIEKKHQPLMDYLNQNEKEMQKKKSRPAEFNQNEKDW